jgi:hypothetical protein
LKTPDDTSLLDAMGAGRPSIVLQHPNDPSRNSSAELLGIPDLLAKNEAEYAEIGQRLLRSTEERERCSKLVLGRYQSTCAPGVLGPRYLSFLEKILQS